MLNDQLAVFISKNVLSQDYTTTVEKYFLPLIEELHKHHVGAKKPIIIGINGAQGSGKSTLADLIVFMLREQFNVTGIAISLDDFYQTKSERLKLSDSVHSLLKTRGVPGTHDIPLAIKTLESLRNHVGEVAIPRFSKALDDRLPKEQWDVIESPVDVIIIEGWCLGALPQTQQQLNVAVNELEEYQDEQEIWRTYVNTQLEDVYKDLFSYIEKWVMLKAPSFDCVLNWRWQQEAKLHNSLEQKGTEKGSGCMSEAELAHFIQHYQRITEHLLNTLPDKVDYLIELDKDRQVKRLLIQQAEKISDQQQWLIFSDMDGTLLDHYSYSHTDADEVLAVLETNAIPVIANTSKTYTEMLVIQKEFNNRHPFIIENGAAVYIPQNYFQQRPEGMFQQDAFWVKSFVQKRRHWQAIIGQVRGRYDNCFKTFSQLGPEQIAQITGLDFKEAYRSSQRQFGEPIIWLADEKLKHKFIDELRELGANVLIGGRFIHVSGHTDKGVAMKWLCQQYQTAFKNKIIKNMALGDSQNDAAMLEQADIAVLIRSPAHDLPVLKRLKGCYISEHEGPKGWAQCVGNLMKNVIKTR